MALLILSGWRQKQQRRIVSPEHVGIMLQQNAKDYGNGLLCPGSPYPPVPPEVKDAIHKELIIAINRLRSEFPAEWQYYGDATETSILERVREQWTQLEKEIIADHC